MIAITIAMMAVILPNASTCENAAILREDLELAIEQEKLNTHIMNFVSVGKPSNRLVSSTGKVQHFTFLHDNFILLVHDLRFMRCGGCCAERRDFRIFPVVFERSVIIMMNLEENE